MGADDKEKAAGEPDPALTATVEGLVGEDDKSAEGAAGKESLPRGGTAHIWPTQ